MKKVIIFLLVLALALGGIGYAHAAVTANQEALVVYPTVEIGDPSVLEGLTASTTITCGTHLQWRTDYPFGGEAATEFVYDRKGTQPPQYASQNELNVWFSGGVGSSVSGGEISPNTTEYGALLQAVAQETPSGGSKTMSLQMADYVNFYQPDYELHYSDDSQLCDESASFHGFVAGDAWYENRGCYVALMQFFRFPVQPGHTMSVTVEKDDAGRIVSIHLSPEEDSPELRFLSDLTAEGIWFVPVFRTADGTPLPYESPQGHGIYFIPWKHNDLYLRTAGQPEQVTPDVKKARLCFPLDENLQIRHMIIDAAEGTARMLTIENGSYVLTICDLETGTVRARMELLPQDPADPDLTAYFFREGDYLLFLLQGQIVLTDAAGETLYLTAPEAADQRFGARYYDPDTGSLRFDGETLILTDTIWYRDGIFWAAAWRQGELRFYGQYDCSIMRGNENWYYSYISAEEYPVILK